MRELDDVKGEQEALAEGRHEAVVRRRGEGEEVDLGSWTGTDDSSCDFAIGGGENWDSEKDFCFHSD